jgi:hypothetical protein
MAVSNKAFEFPDEQASAPAKENDFEIEIVDDVPAEDKDPVTGKMKAPMPEDIVKELDNDDLEEYSDKVKKRLGQMKKVWHDERRAKESAEREKAELLRVAQMREEENRQLKQRLSAGEKVYIEEVSKAATNELAVAKDKLRQAYEAGDAAQITDAQDFLTDAKLKLRDVGRFQPSLQTEESSVQETTSARARQVPPSAIDPKAEAWRQSNTWFGVNKGMTAFALGLHEELVESGVDPRSDDYYKRVDQDMRKRFSDYFGDAAEQTVEREEKPVQRTKPANVVAPVTRSTAPRQVRLTPTQVAIAKKLGLSNEQYARELFKLENNNG